MAKIGIHSTPILVDDFDPAEPSNGNALVADDHLGRIARDQLYNEFDGEVIKRNFYEHLTENALVINDHDKSNYLTLVVQMHESARGIRKHYIEIGAILLRIYRDAPDLYRSMTEKENKILPFTKSVAVKLRRIAAIVEQDKTCLSYLPSAYSAAYEVVIMDDQLRNRAIQEGIVHSNAKRDEITQWKKLHALENITEKKRAKTKKDICNELQSLYDEQMKFETAMQKLKKMIEEKEKELSACERIVG